MKRAVFQICVLLVLVPASFAAAGGSQEEEQAAVLANRVVVEENWEFSWKFAGDEVEFTLIAPTTGWVGIGFEPSRAMRDASYVIGYVSGGEVFIREDFGTGNTSHASDVSLGGTQDVRVISGVEEAGKTTLVFAIPRDSGDEFDTVLNPGESYTVLLAYGPNGSNNFTARHQSRRTIEVKL